MRAASISLNGIELVADLTGAVFWPARQTVAVADLHLEKGSSFAQRGSHLPPYDTRTTLARLAEVVTRYRPRHVICIGDSFHDDGAAHRLAGSDAADLRRLTSRCDWTWICGNHDVRPSTDWGGRGADDVGMGPLSSGTRHSRVPAPARSPGICIRRPDSPMAAASA